MQRKVQPGGIHTVERGQVGLSVFRTREKPPGSGALCIQGRVASTRPFQTADVCLTLRRGSSGYDPHIDIPW